MLECHVNGQNWFLGHKVHMFRFIDHVFHPRQLCNVLNQKIQIMCNTRCPNNWKVILHYQITHGLTIKSIVCDHLHNTFRQRFCFGNFLPNAKNKILKEYHVSNSLKFWKKLRACFARFISPPPLGCQIKARIQNNSIALLVLLSFNVKSFLGC
jgi:hypothetical protein